MYSKGNIIMGLFGQILGMASSVYSASQQSSQAREAQKNEDRRYADVLKQQAIQEGTRKKEQKSILQQQSYQQQEKKKKYLSGSSVLG